MGNKTYQFLERPVELSLPHPPTPSIESFTSFPSISIFGISQKGSPSVSRIHPKWANLKQLHKCESNMNVMKNQQ